MKKPEGAGKASILDCIWMALGGKAEIKLDFGEMRVIRKFSNSGTTLLATGKYGAVFRSPQSLLDALTGKTSFDPLSYMRLDEKKKYEELLKNNDLHIDLDELAARRIALAEDVNKSNDKERTALRNLTEEAELTRDKIKDLEKKLTIERERLADTLTKFTEQRSKKEALGNANSPILELSIEDNTVIFNGLPLYQASRAEKIRVCMAIAMAINPKICEPGLLMYPC